MRPFIGHLEKIFINNSCLYFFLGLFVFFPFSVFGFQHPQCVGQYVQNISDQTAVEGSKGTGIRTDKDYPDPFPKDPETYKPMPLPDPTKYPQKKGVGDPETPVGHPVEKKQKE